MRTTLQQARHFAAKRNSLQAAERHLNSVGVTTYGIVLGKRFSYVDIASGVTVIQCGEEFLVGDPNEHSNNY